MSRIDIGDGIALDTDTWMLPDGLVENLIRILGVNNNAPDWVFHYSNLESLMNIAKSKKFWASDSFFLNDSSEIEHTWSMIKEISSYYSKKINNKRIKDALNIYTEGNWRLGYSYQCFVISFCEVPDLLSQWRGYTSPHDGICIGLNTKWLKFNLIKVNYDEEMQYESIKYIFEKFIELFEIGIEHEKTANQFPSFDYASKFLYEYLSQLSLVFKRSSFSEESEWRAFIVVNLIKNENLINYRIKKSPVMASQLVAPYLEVDYIRGHNPIQHLILHPARNDSNVSMRTIQKMLKSFGCEVREIVRSKIPLQ